MAPHWTCVDASKEETLGIVRDYLDARYFNLGKIKSDELEAYADARSEATDESRRWLAPVLESES